MKFEEALKAMREGKKVYRLSYPRNKLSMRNKNIFVGGRLCIELLEAVITAEDWEIYQEPTPDWDYIIKNKCLCWFWDLEDYKDLGILIEVNENNKLCRYDCRKSNGDFYRYANCRPVRKDEITFYEDKKDD